MRGWIVYNQERLARNAAYAQMHQDWCNRHGVHLRLEMEESITTNVSSHGVRFLSQGTPLELPDFAIFRCEAPDLRRSLEQAGVVVSNGSRVGELANDKLKTYMLAARLGLPFLCVEVLPAREVLPSLPFPLVVKPRYGHGGEGVSLVSDEQEYHAFLCERVEHGSEHDWLAQRLCPVVGKDLRVYVLGKKVIAAMLRTAREGELRSNYCLGGSATPYGLTHEERSHVQTIADALGDGYYGIDFMFDQDNRLLFNEVEDIVGSRMLYAHTSIDVVHEHLSYVTKRANNEKIRHRT